MTERELRSSFSVFEGFARNYLEVIRANALLRNIIREAETLALARRPDIEVSDAVLLCMVGIPALAALFPTAVLETLEAYQRAVSSDEAINDLESAFVISEQDGFFHTSDVIPKPHRPGLPMPPLKTIDAPRRQTIAAVHTHPPDRLLIPSVYETDRNGKESGDLYAFSIARSERLKSMKRGERPAFAKNLLFIIMQSTLSDSMETSLQQLLFITETPQIGSLSQQEYIQNLKQTERYMTHVSSQLDVLRGLRSSDFRATLVSMSVAEMFSSYPILSPEMHKQVVDELQL